jgi:hypothetical protein
VKSSVAATTAPESKDAIAGESLNLLFIGNTSSSDRTLKRNFDAGDFPKFVFEFSRAWEVDLPEILSIGRNYTIALKSLITVSKYFLKNVPATILNLL